MPSRCGELILSDEGEKMKRFYIFKDGTMQSSTPKRNRTLE